MSSADPLAPTVTPFYSYRHPLNDVNGVIRNYTPRTPKRFWNDDVQEFTRSAVTELDPKSEADARAYLGNVSRLAIWTINIACLPLRRDIVFAAGNIDKFLHDRKAVHTAKSLNSMRLRLYQIGRELGTNVPPAASKGKRSSGEVVAPYTAPEMVRFRNQGATRSTPSRRHNWMTLLALAAGCGLNSIEIMALPVSSIRFDADAVRVIVDGPRPRTVICLEVWEEDLRQVAASPLVDHYVFVKAERPTYANIFVPRYVIRAANEGRAFNVERLRATWIVTHLNAGTPLFALVRAMGQKDIGTFSRFERFVDDLDVDAHTAAFRQVRA